MRTKTAMLTAALVAAGALSSVAQNVYSVNVVGYVNVTLKPGYNLIANQLKNPSNGINTVLTNAAFADSTTLFKWAGSGFTQADSFYNGLGWADGSFNPSVTTVAPGEGFFIQSTASTNITLTLVGEVPQGTNTIVVKPGYSFLAQPVPMVSGFSTNGFPALADSSTYQTFTGVGYSQALSFYNGLGWADGSFNVVDPAPAVGQGFLIFNTGAQANWVETFVVQ